ncbi:MAG: glycosyltransferase family 4 protein, partial [Deltaproteobacteria bacterium]
RVVGCVGTMTNWYLREPMLNYLALLVRRIDRIKILIVTAEDHGRLRADAERSGVDPRRIVLTRAEFHEMPELLRLVDVGLFFIKVCFSKKGSAATKLGEFLATGVPVIINDRVGDSGSIVREGRVGVVLPDVTPEAFEASLDAVRQVLSDSEIARRCRDVARHHFDLARGVSSYDGVYSRIITIRA